jgi:hypothetical protein
MVFGSKKNSKQAKDDSFKSFSGRKKAISQSNIAVFGYKKALFGG